MKKKISTKYNAISRIGQRNIGIIKRAAGIINIENSRYGQ
jgi:hypothetical protein